MESALTTWAPGGGAAMRTCDLGTGTAKLELAAKLLVRNARDREHAWRITARITMGCAHRTPESEMPLKTLRALLGAVLMAVLGLGARRRPR